MIGGGAYPQRYSLWLEGQDAGRLHSVEGGEPYGEVVAVTYPPPDTSIEKHISAVHYVDIALTCGVVPPAPLMDWISGMLGGLAPVHAGAVVPQQPYTKQARLEFTNAVIREVEFPGLNTAAKQQPVYMTARVAPGFTRRVTGSQPSSAGAVGPSLYGANFTLEIPGLDCSHVAEIGPLVVRQTPNGLDVADLVVTLPEDEDWYDWRDDLLGPTHLGFASTFRKTGRLEYNSPAKDVVAKIDFTGLGIHSVVVESATASASQSTRKMRVSMFCESLRYTVVPPATADATAQLVGSPDGVIRSRVDAIAPLAARLARPAAPG